MPPLLTIIGCRTIMCISYITNLFTVIQFNNIYGTTMNRYIHTRTVYRKIYCIFIIYVLSSCISDSYISECYSDVYLQFRYTYNIKQSDAFAYEVERVHVWVFDSDGRFLSQHIDENEHLADDYSLHIGYLPPGGYTFVAWCRSTRYDEDSSNYIYTEMTPGVSVITDLTARLPRTEDNYYKVKLNSTLNGTASASLQNGKQTVMIDLMKCTNTLRVILMPYRAGQLLDSDNFQMHISGRNAWLNYDGSIYKEDPVIYRPYYKTTIYDEQAKVPDNGPVDNAIIADMNISRLFYDLGPRLVIKDVKNDKTLMDINLTWLLSLQVVGEHKEEWGAQEYLDRQDSYSIIFFMDGDTFMQNTVIINGWTISLENNELQ